MEMPKGGHNRIPDEKRLEIAEYIEAFPKDSYKKIADAFGVSRNTVNNIAIELKVGTTRPHSFGPQARAARAVAASALKGDEKAPRRLAKDTQEEQILDYWMANHHDMTLSELARWVRQQFNIVTDRHSMVNMLERAAAKQVPPVQLPPPDPGKGARLKKQRSQHRNEPGTGKLPTQGSQYFDPGTTINPPKPPGE
jgi:transposase-like protein